MKKHNYLKSFKSEKPLDFYPRPSLERDSLINYLNLNGTCDCEIKKEDEIDLDKISFTKEILVPYPIESTLSGLEYDLGSDEVICYHKHFSYSFNKAKTILHIDGSDNITKVYLNNKYIGSHTGGYLPFSFDVSDVIKEENDLIILVSDKMDLNYPYGKQSKKNGGIWYTKTSGIWKTVWLESVESDYIERLKIDTDIDKKTLRINYFKEGFAYVEVYFKGLLIKEVSDYISGSEITFSDIHLWTCDNPNLYDLVIRYNDDEVKSYFAFRKISIVNHDGHKVFALNNEPFFMHGLLDQGYYHDGILTPSSFEALKKDLEVIKEYGFNTLRKHIKVEPEIWYYLCDKMGIIVWQDFVNSFKYNFFFDSLLPTVGLKKRSLKIASFSKEAKEFFINHSIDTIEFLYNHPSIVLWTIFNEGWGQFDTKEVYDLIKPFDATRIFDSASGWFMNHKEREIESLHVYFKPIKIKKKYEKPLVISEFGGYALKISDHTYYDKAFGYKIFDTLDEYNEAILKLYEKDIKENMKKGVCASIYTQVSDVEEEINGIMTYDREIIKLDKEVALKIKELLKF